MSIRKTITVAIAALTLGTAVAVPANAQAMGFGMIGDLALAAVAAEAAPRRAVIVEHRYVRRGNRLQYCGRRARHARVHP